MRSSKGAFGRIDGEYDHFVGEQSCPDWLSNFADKIASEDHKTAVEVARERNQNVYQEMSGILSGDGPKFSSVDDVVEDYKRRTGMSEFKTRRAAAAAAQIIKNSDDLDQVDDILDIEDDQSGKKKVLNPAM